MNNNIDITRHVDVFSRNEFSTKRFDVIGAGATGSRIAISLAKLGLENIHVWDFDKVEAHNIANQAFGQSDLGKLKVDAVADQIREATGLEITTHNERVNGSQPLGDVVFLLTDTMASRKEIWEKAIRFKVRTKLMIETRMGVDQGRVYAINPINRAQVLGWQETLCADEEAIESVCGAKISVGPTADLVSGLAIWQLINWQKVQKGAEDNLDHEIIFGVSPLFTMTKRF
jgi:predicted ThiF/HesA family dinucleotide-utilizing enzyme